MHDQAVVDAAIEVFGYSKAILKRMA